MLVTARLIEAPSRRGGRAVECTALEMRHACKGIGGSNPPLSATLAKSSTITVSC